MAVHLAQHAGWPAAARFAGAVEAAWVTAVLRGTAGRWWGRFVAA